jgi:dihydroxyacid dehydratase/phosphogluconate dehydratase
MRMSGTELRDVLHVCPESAIGGAAALVRGWGSDRTGCAGRRLNLQVDDAERAAARKVASGGTLRSRLRGSSRTNARRRTKGAISNFCTLAGGRRRSRISFSSMAVPAMFL